MCDESKFLTPFTSPVHNEKIGYQRIILFFASLVFIVIVLYFGF